MLVFGLIDMASHNYFLAAAVTFFLMEASCFYSSAIQFCDSRDILVIFNKQNQRMYVQNQQKNT